MGAEKERAFRMECHKADKRRSKRGGSGRTNGGWVDGVGRTSRKRTRRVRTTRMVAFIEAAEPEVDVGLVGRGGWQCYSTVFNDWQ